MDLALSSARKPSLTAYSTSKSLYGGDIAIENELEQYFQGNSKKKKRQKVKVSMNEQNFTSFESAEDSNLSHVTADPIVGTCQTVEKDYYRLTSAPTSLTVRPFSVLVKALELVKKRWKSNLDYSYCCNQLKSLRQDLMVQHVKNEFTVQVYEIHGRIALESGDFGEFGQCQSQLHELYRSGITGNNAEFAAYKILHYLKWNRWNDVHLIDFIDFQLPPAVRSHPAVQHAIQVRKSLAINSYVNFFRLYQETPNMGIYLLDSVANKMRRKSLNILIHAYRPKLEVELVNKLLAFDSLKECRQYLSSLNLVMDSDRDNGEMKAIDTKLSQPIMIAALNNSEQSASIESSSDSATSVSPAIELTLAQKMALAMGLPTGKRSVNSITDVQLNSKSAKKKKKKK
jgi:hypothetical protein